MRLERAEADLQHPAGAAPRVEDGAAAAFAVRIDEVVDRGFEPGLGERIDH